MRRVVASDGRTWLVRVRLPWPRWRRWRMRDGDWAEALAWLPEIGTAGLVIFLVAAGWGLVTALFLPLLLFLIEIPIVLFGIFFLGRRCFVDAWPEHREHETVTREARGLAQAGRVREEMEHDLTHYGRPARRE